MDKRRVKKGSGLSRRSIDEVATEICGHIEGQPYIPSEVERLVRQADKKQDAEETAYSGELFLLRKVFEAASDHVDALHWPEFAECNPKTEAKLTDTVIALKQWLSEFE